jgi:cytochrome P450
VTESRQADVSSVPQVSFDHNSPEYAAHRHEWFEELRNRTPVFYSPAHGGFYTSVDHRDVVRAYEDWENLSSRHLAEPENGIDYRGVFCPAKDGQVILSTDDPPVWNRYRRAVSTPFTRKASAGWIPRMEYYAHACLDRRIETGTIDFVYDYAAAVPSMVTMELVGLDVGQWVYWSRALHGFTAYAADAPEFADVMKLHAECMDNLREAVQQHRREPRSGLISYMIEHGTEQGPFSDEEIAAMCYAIIGGGAETTAALVSSSLLYLYRNPDLRNRLIADPALIEPATDEFLRFLSPLQSMARTVTSDQDYAGCPIPANSRFVLLIAAANRDPKEFPDADRFVPDRSPNRHIGFGSGIHTCIGQHIARYDFQVMLRAVLERMPDYVIDEADCPPIENQATVAGYLKMPATFPPGARLGDAELPGFGDKLMW